MLGLLYPAWIKIGTCNVGGGNHNGAVELVRFAKFDLMIGAALMPMLIGIRVSH